MRCSGTGENWTNWYYYTVLVTSPIVASIFQIFYFILSNYVLISMFVAIILRNFDANEEEKERQQRTAYTKMQDVVTRACFVQRKHCAVWHGRSALTRRCFVVVL